MAEVSKTVVKASVYACEAWRAAGLALKTIRDDRLYELEDFSTFEDYCRDEWGLTQGKAEILIRLAVLCDRFPGSRLD